MIRIFYNPQSGEITQVSDSRLALDQGFYIDVESAVAYNLYKVNVITKELESKPAQPLATRQKPR